MPLTLSAELLLQVIKIITKGCRNDKGTRGLPYLLLPPVVKTIKNFQQHKTKKKEKNK